MKSSYSFINTYECLSVWPRRFRGHLRSSEVIHCGQRENISFKNQVFFGPLKIAFKFTYRMFALHFTLLRSSKFNKIVLDIAISRGGRCSHCFKNRFHSTAFATQFWNFFGCFWILKFSTDHFSWIIGRFDTFGSEKLRNCLCSFSFVKFAVEFTRTAEACRRCTRLCSDKLVKIRNFIGWALFSSFEYFWH